MALTAAGAGVTRSSEPDGLLVRGRTEAQVADVAFANRILVHHLAPARVSLEQAFMELTADSVDYHAGVPAGQSSAHSSSAHSSSAHSSSAHSSSARTGTEA